MRVVRVWRCLGVCLACLLPAAPATAQTTNWTAGVGLWTNPANWSSGVPAAGISATVSNGGTVQVTTAGQACNNFAIGGPVHSRAEVTGAGRVSCSSLGVANNVGGDGSLSVAGGGQMTVDTFLGGAGAAGTATITGSGSRIQVSTTTQFGGTPPAGGTFILNVLDGGEISAPSIVLAGDGTTATVNVGDGGNAGVVSGDIAASASAGSATVRFNHSDDITFGSRITGQVAVIKDGAGTLRLTATSTYTGATTVNAGALLIDGSQGSSAISLTGGRLGGTGTTGAITATGGTVAPGASPGILTSSAATFNAATTFSVELNGATSGTQYDQLRVTTGGVTLGGATLAVSNGVAHAAGTSFAIIDKQSAGAVSGTFAGLAEGASTTLGGQAFTISYVGGDGNDVVLTAIAAVPSLPVWGLAALAALLGVIAYVQFRAAAR